MIKLKNFKPHELVGPISYAIHADKAIEEIDVNLLTFIDELHGYISSLNPGKKVSIVINDWKWGGQFSNRGLRLVDYYGTVEKYNKSRSQHKYGRALDFDVYIAGELQPAQNIRSLIISIRAFTWARCISFIEDGVNWVHVDVRATENNMLVLWHMKTHKTTMYERG